MQTFFRIGLWGALLLCTGICPVQAQVIAPSTLNATGGSAVSGGYTFEWSVAEMTLVHTAAVSSITVTQGLLQPSEQKGDTTSVAEQIAAYKLHVYPNPASDYIILETQLDAPASWILQLFDAAGKSLFIESGISSGNGQHLINMQPYAAGSYYLQVKTLSGNQPYLNHFRIQKIH